MKTHSLLVLAAMLGCLAVTGCQQRESPTVAKSEEAAADVELGEARLTLPAVKGNPGAAYFTVVNRTAQPLSLIGVEVAGAERTEMHDGGGANMTQVDRVTVPAGGNVAFIPTGYHAMVFGVPASLKVDGHAQITLKFEDGRRVSASAQVRAPGMAETDHGATH